MKIPLLILCLVSALGCAKKPEVVVINLSSFDAPLSVRKEWVREQKRISKPHFEQEYGWLLTAKSIDAKEAQQIAYLYFYSSGQECGYLDNPRLVDGVWRWESYVRFQERAVDQVLVDARSGQVWQDGHEKLDAMKLLRTK
jgi:hypothetical protein